MKYPSSHSCNASTGSVAAVPHGTSFQVLPYNSKASVSSSMPCRFKNSTTCAAALVSTQRISFVKSHVLTQCCGGEQHACGWQIVLVSNKSGDKAAGRQFADGISNVTFQDIFMNETRT